MRVIAGQARGTRLETLPGTDVTRPTVDRVKEGMFSSVQFILPGAQVLDLFAGSGQLGIEALSRGAARCVFVDESREAVGIVTANLKAAGLYRQTVVANTSAEGFLAGTKDRFDLVLLDPPYRKGTVEKMLSQVGEICAQGAVVLAETERGAYLPEQAGCLVKKKQYQYGTVWVTRYEKEQEE